MSYRPPGRPPFSRDYDRPPGGYAGGGRPPSSSGPSAGSGYGAGPDRGQFRPPPYNDRYSDRYSDDGPGGRGGRHGGPGAGPGHRGRGGRRGAPRGRREDRDFRDRDREYGNAPDQSHTPGPPGPPGPPGHDGAGPRKSRIPVQTRDAPSEAVRLERLARERVSRTLFIRNIAYETNSDKFRDQFAAFGEIKEWFDSIQRRGLVFVTFYDVRAAEAARLGMQGTRMYGRQIDVHFGLPKEHDQDGPCDRTKNQGSLLVSLRPRRMLEERELAEAAEQSGAIKSIRTCGYPEQRIIEYYDSRAAVDFYDRMDGRDFMDGTLEIKFIWDVGDAVNPDPVVADRAAQAATTHVPAERRTSWGSTTSSSAAPGPRYGSRDYVPPAGVRYESAKTRYAEAPPPNAPPAAGTGRLQEARKVQDLLTSLGNVASFPPPAPAPAPAPATPGYTPAQQGYAPPPTNYAPPAPAPPAPAPAPTAYPPPRTYAQGSYPPPPAQNYTAPAPQQNYPPPPQTYPQQQGYTPTSAQPPAQPPAPAQAPYSYPPAGSPAQNYPPAGSPPAPQQSLPAQVLAMLNAGQQQPHQQPHAQHAPHQPPTPTYQQPPTPTYGQQPPMQTYGQQRPPPHQQQQQHQQHQSQQHQQHQHQPPPHQHQHQQPPHQQPPHQQQEGYDPKKADVGALLAMLQR